MMMPQAVEEKNLWYAAFHSARAESGRRDTAWVEQLREEAIDRFARLGFPTTDREEWRYTNVAPIARGVFTLDAGAAGAPEAAGGAADFIHDEARHSCLVFINGNYRSDLSSTLGLPPGVVAGDFRDALAEGEHAATVLRERLARLAITEGDAFVALNTAFLRSGAFLYIPEGVKVEAPIELLFLSAPGAEPTASFPRVLVVAGRASEATIIESYAAMGGETVYFTNSVTEVFVEAEARLVHYKVQRESERAYHIAALSADLGRSSSYDLTTITLGSQLSRHGIKVTLDHEGAECWVDGLYLVGDGQHADTHSLIDHRKPHCTSHQNYKGILDGRSRAVFNGRVFVHRDAQQTDAKQSNKNLLLSNEARVDTKPQLEIFADDVKCAHGATVGQLEEEELFYLASRGLHAELARNLLTYGFAEELVEKIKIESIKAQLDESILNRLHARLEV